jgi:hypothetical protein
MRLHISAACQVSIGLAGQVPDVPAHCTNIHQPGLHHGCDIQPCSSVSSIRLQLRVAAPVATWLFLLQSQVIMLVLQLLVAENNAIDVLSPLQPVHQCMTAVSASS